MRQLKIRFKKYNDVWDNVKLTEIAPIVMGQSPDSKNYTDNPNDYILVQGNADMQNGRVVPRVWTTQITKLAEKGDLILSVRAPVGDIGKTDYNVVLGRGVAAIKGNEFLFQLLTKMKQYHYWARFSTGSTFESINSNDIKSAEIYLPSPAEQQAIGSLFRTLDDLLSSYKDNLANYQSIKTTMLSKMFPKAGQAVPEIRLDGFEGEWKKDTLEPYLTESRISGDTGLTAKKITVKLWGKGVIEKEEKYAGSSNTQYFVRKAGQFIYSKLDFQNQAFGIIPNELDGYQSTLDLPSFDIQNIDPKFLLEYVMRREFYEYQGLIANGSRKAKRIHPEDFLVMPVRIPSLEEQQAIGSYFSNIDNFINSYQEKITQLETLKKKLLQDMFI
ncbi:Type I restriction-modification system, specificity subunit S [Streptococcus thermophilus]|uniref:Type I restriction-modification system, specificity subunit S n=1 Tax=Streptococcus thermophilus TaxID=1308 RepID=A0A8D6U290_STRTR|nr:restriction endonuclease subunit S [Streptococcus thermophilus]PJH84586.1 restriction endonuclease subunit S [Streptococcus thermophilus]CAD0137117.1 Type I restriction-modification system, specificity subunit S [Streptococcus thermophilus]